MLSKARTHSEILNLCDAYSLQVENIISTLCYQVENKHQPLGKG